MDQVITKTLHKEIFIYLAFFEAQPKNAIVNPPPNLETIASNMPAFPPSRAFPRARPSNFFERILHTVVHTILQLHNCSFFKLSSNTKQMPALVIYYDFQILDRFKISMLFIVSFEIYGLLHRYLNLFLYNFLAHRWLMA
jgi:hypothetical protein